MNWPFIGAGCIALLGSLIHGIVGDGLVRRVDTASLGRRGKFLIRATWHFTTIAFVVLGIGLVAIGARANASPAVGIALTAGTLFSLWSLLVVVGSFLGGGARAWLSHPAPILLSVTAALIWWGLTL